MVNNKTKQQEKTRRRRRKKLYQIMYGLLAKSYFMYVTIMQSYVCIMKGICMDEKGTALKNRRKRRSSSGKSVV